MTTATRLVTLEEFLSWPEEQPALELIDGIPEQKPVPSLPHSRATTKLMFLLHEHPATSKGEVLAELGKSYHTPLGNHRVPDLSFSAERRIPGSGELYPAEPPDLVAEVKSKGQGRDALLARLRFLLSQGVRVGLLIDPERATVTVVDTVGERRFAKDDEVAIPEVGAFSFRASQLFE
ncbi:MAG: Uma2 family endonuclease [Chloroflexi bacterium]|nr:Uma2 family endonuclease [Chloroflexota bacterium]